MWPCACEVQLGVRVAAADAAASAWGGGGGMLVGGGVRWVAGLLALVPFPLRLLPLPPSSFCIYSIAFFCSLYCVFARG